MRWTVSIGSPERTQEEPTVEVRITGIAGARLLYRPIVLKTMTWWIQLYLVLYVIFSIAGLWDDYRSKRQIRFFIGAGFSNSIVVFLFVCYWHASGLSGMGGIAQVAFVGAMGWELFQAIQDIKAEKEDSGSLGDVILGPALAAEISLPAYIVAGISAFRL